MSGHLFIRDDDACRLNKHFRLFFDAAMEREVPVVYAVIPGRLEKEMIQFFRRAKEKRPDLLDIVQHGWTHENHSKVKGKKYEFGTSRSLETQREDVAQGFEIMHHAFGKYFTPAFVPPYHGYDRHTLKVINQSGFEVFSAHARVRLKGCVNMPVHVSFTRYGKDGVHAIPPASAVLEEVMKKACGKSIIGVVTHHGDFKTATAHREWGRFLDGIDLLRKKKNWRVHLFSDILRMKRKSKERG